MSIDRYGSSLRLSYPRDLAKTLHDWLVRHRELELSARYKDADQQLEKRAQSKKLCLVPTEEHLAQMLDVAFFASFAREEGRNVSLSMNYWDPQAIVEYGFDHLQFQKPIPLTVESVRKLSPALTPGGADIAAFEFEGQLRIWGLGYLGGKANDLPYIAYAPQLYLASHQTGEISVRWGQDEVLMYSRGHAVFPEHLSAGWFDEHRLLDLMANVSGMQRRQVDAMISGDYRCHVEWGQLALRVALAALRDQRGATVFVIPAGTVPAGLETPRYACHEGNKQEFRALMAFRYRYAFGDNFARLAFIDGAIVFDQESNFVGAGAMVQTGGAPEFQIELVDPARPSESPKRITLSAFSGGARHISALVFAYRNPGCLALVVSHDGVCSIVARNRLSDVVTAVRPIRKGVELWAQYLFDK